MNFTFIRFLLQKQDREAVSIQRALLYVRIYIGAFSNQIFFKENIYFDIKKWIALININLSLYKIILHFFYLMSCLKSQDLAC